MFDFSRRIVVAKTKSVFWTFPKKISCCKEEVGQSVRSKVLTKGQRRAQKLGQCRSTGEKIGQLCSQQSNTHMHIVKRGIEWTLCSWSKIDLRSMIWWNWRSLLASLISYCEEVLSEQNKKGRNGRETAPLLVFFLLTITFSFLLSFVFKPKLCNFLFWKYKLRYPMQRRFL